MQLSSLDQSKTYTYADYSKWDFPERVELINGKIYEMMAAPSLYHQDIVGDIYTPIKNALHGKTCKVYFAPIDVYLSGNSENDTVLQPDICVICDSSKLNKKKACIGAPDIVVEVLSPGNSVKEMRLKYALYEGAGVLEYWVVSPQNLFFIVHKLINGKFVQEPVKTLGDIITSMVLPGFSLDLSELFKNAPAEDE